MIFSYRIKATTFVKLAEEITRLFPTEAIETYYIPYASPLTTGGSKQGARGKLWSRFVNVKAIRAASRCSSCTVTRSRSSSPKKKEDDEFQKSTENKDLIFLKTAIEPFPKILGCWESTHVLRTKIYKTKCLQDILDDFPCIRLQFGIELVSIIVNHL